MLCMGKSYYEAVHEMDDEYLGHTVNFKTRKHFKDKKSKYVSEDNEAFFRSIQNEMEESEKTEMEKKRKEQGSQMVKKGFRNWNA